jgi:hypothetical protein
MPSEGKRGDLILANNETGDIKDKTTGNIYVFKGAHKEALSSDMQPCKWDGKKFVDVDDLAACIKQFVKATEIQYVILKNPLKTTREMTKGKNEFQPLDTGVTQILHGPTEFPLWPGQEAEVVDGHRLAEDEYLNIMVTGPISEDDAKKLWPIVEEDWLEGQNQQPSPKEPALLPASEEPAGGEAGENKDEGESSKETNPPAPPSPPATTMDNDQNFVDKFPMGAKFVVRGTRTKLFMPPTGIEVIPVEEKIAVTKTATNALKRPRDSRPRDDIDTARHLEITKAKLAEIKGKFLSMYRDHVGEDELDRRQAERILEHLFSRQNIPQRYIFDYSTMLQALNKEHILNLDEFDTAVDETLDKYIATLEKEIKLLKGSQEMPLTTDNYIRKGIPLEADEYAMLMNRIGRKSIVYGPTTVVPCIDQEFIINQESGTPVFKGIPIDIKSGVLLQTNTKMTVKQAKQRVPFVQILGDLNDKEELAPGTLLVVWKRETCVFPADGIDIVEKFEAVHIPAGKAKYLQNMETGKVQVVKGEKMYLPDPRREQFVQRNLTQKEIQLWFLGEEYDPAFVPCIKVPQGTAAKIQGFDSQGKTTQEVIEGFDIVFLAWDQQLAVLKVSASDFGEPKTHRGSKDICFLWTQGNVINDTAANLRSRDDCKFSLSYALTVDFQENKQDDWFAVDDYVGLVCEEVRSILRGIFLRGAIHEISTDYVDVARDAILGIKKENEEDRPGRDFKRCGAKVVEVNVISFNLDDDKLAGRLNQVQQASLEESLQTKQAKVKLEGALARLDITAKERSAKANDDEEERKLRLETTQAKAELDKKILDIDAELAKKRIAVSKEERELRQEEDMALREFKASEDKAKTESKKTIANLEKEIATLECAAAISRLEPVFKENQAKADNAIKKMEAQAQAVAKVNESVMPEIKAALTQLADTELATTVAEHLGKVAHLKGVDVLEVLNNMAGKSPIIKRVLSQITEIGDNVLRGETKED